jgi:prolyl-tRNA synthetase
MKRWSQFFIPTLKESPADAEIASHRLLVRAGLVRRLGGGLYTYLPLGLRAVHKITQLCREEMDGAGAIELWMPHLHPVELWAQGPRWAAAREIMFRADSAGAGRRSGGAVKPTSAIARCMGLEEDPLNTPCKHTRTSKLRALYVVSGYYVLHVHPRLSGFVF